MDEMNCPSTIAKSLVEHFEKLPDPRMKRTRCHKLVDILVIGLCSELTGGEGFNEMEAFGTDREEWLRTFLELPNGIPTHDTFNRVFSAIAPEAFLECFVQWVQGICPRVDGETVAIDGKALRRALDAGKPIPYIVNAWASESGLVLGQVKVDDKSNEITAIPKLLEVLDIDGCVVTLDAMGCQKEIAANIIDKNADYVLALKGNHATVHEEVREFFKDAVLPCARECADTVAEGTMDFFETTGKGHGRIETRRYWISTDIDWFEDRPLWKGLFSIGMVESIRCVKGKNSIERRFFLASLPRCAKRLAKAVREHWGVENTLHWSLDVTLREDDSRARTNNAPQNLAMLRRIVLNLLKKDKSKKRALKAKQRSAARSTDYLQVLLGI